VVDVRSQISIGAVDGQLVARRPRHGIPGQDRLATAVSAEDKVRRCSRHLRYRYRCGYRPPTGAIGITGRDLEGVRASGSTGHTERGCGDGAGDRCPGPTVEALLHGVTGGTDGRSPTYGEGGEGQTTGHREGWQRRRHPQRGRDRPWTTVGAAASLHLIDVVAAIPFGKRIAGATYVSRGPSASVEAFLQGIRHGSGHGPPAHRVVAVVGIAVKRDRPRRYELRIRVAGDELGAQIDEVGGLGRTGHELIHQLAAVVVEGSRRRTSDGRLQYTPTRCVVGVAVEVEDLGQLILLIEEQRVAVLGGLVATTVVAEGVERAGAVGDAAQLIEHVVVVGERLATGDSAAQVIKRVIGVALIDRQSGSDRAGQAVKTVIMKYLATLTVDHVLNGAHVGVAVITENLAEIWRAPRPVTEPIEKLPRVLTGCIHCAVAVGEARHLTVRPVGDAAGIAADLGGATERIGRIGHAFTAATTVSARIAHGREMAVGVVGVTNTPGILAIQP